MQGVGDLGVRRGETSNINSGEILPRPHTDQLTQSSCLDFHFYSSGIFTFLSFEISRSEYCFLISRLSVQNIDTLIFLISRTGFFSRISESGHMGSVQLSRRNSTPRLSTIRIFKARFYSNPGVGHLLIFCSAKNQAKVSILCRQRFQIWS